MALLETSMLFRGLWDEAGGSQYRALVYRPTSKQAGKSPPPGGLRQRERSLLADEPGRAD